MMDKINEQWDQLTSKQKQMAIWGVVGVCVMAVGAVYVTGGEQIQIKKKEQPIVRDVLTGQGADQLGVQALAGKIRDMSKNVEDMQELMEQREEEHERERQAFIEEFQKRDERLMKELSDTKDAVKEKDRIISKIKQELSSEFDRRSAETALMLEQVGEGKASVQTPQVVDSEWEIFSNVDSAAFATPTAGASTDHTQEATLAYTSYVDEAIAHDDAEKIDFSKFLPAGSIVSGVILTGMDAPTDKKAKQDPVPSLIRIKHDAILPNRHASDIRECFITAAGFGDLSSERAMIRSERISCVTHDGKVLETKFDAYAVGEDSKAGVRGRLVSKQGSVLANAMIAGFASGLATAFQPQAIPVLAQSSTGTTQYQQPNANDVLTSSAYAGVGTSMEKLADYFLELADEMHPVIEVDAGRKISFVIQSGFELKFAQVKKDEKKKGAPKKG
jgi:conjugal transfer pilus assembly protein TraB